MEEDFQRDIEAISRIPAVRTILRLICGMTGMGFAAVARVTEERWIACSVLDEIAFGVVPGGELKVETTICNEIRDKREPVVIDHVAKDKVYGGHPTPAMYGFQSYISVPIILPNGEFFGTLCSIDPRPAKLNTPTVIDTFRMFAELIAMHLEMERRVRLSDGRLRATGAMLTDSWADLAASRTSIAESEENLAIARQAGELREQFVAVLGHDLRNPLASIHAGTAMLLRRQLDQPAQQVVRLMQASVHRMKGIIDNVTDFAQGRLGSGIDLDRQDIAAEPVLTQVLDEIRTAWPDRRFDTDFSLAEPVSVDPGRLGQLLSNLLSNAVTHGAPDTPVRVRAASARGGLELSVSNAGPAIPPATLRRIFEPFVRGLGAAGRVHGLGLGLYISSEIARAHGGTLTASSNADQTRFTLRIPGRGAG